jgi:hypothetical protein
MGDVRSGRRAGSRDPRPARMGDVRSGRRAGSRDPRPARRGLERMGEAHVGRVGQRPARLL